MTTSWPFLACTMGFLLLPTILLTLRWIRAKWMPWWAVALITLTVGWALAFGAATTADRPAEQSGAPELFALMFGWLYALLWLLPHLTLYGAIRWVLRALRPKTPTTEPRHPDIA